MLHMMAECHPNDGELHDMLFEKGVSPPFRSNASLANVASIHEIQTRVLPTDFASHRRHIRLCGTISH
jgi:hypothetical protein